MALLRDIPPVAGKIIWATGIERELEGLKDQMSARARNATNMIMDILHSPRSCNCNMKPQRDYPQRMSHRTLA